jgi:hypothetical protein
MATADTGSATQTITITVPTVTMINFRPGTNSLAVVAPSSGKAGDAPEFTGTFPTTLQYTSISAGTSRTITAISDLEVPGIDLNVAMTAIGSSNTDKAGNVGTVASGSQVINKTSAVVLVGTNMGSCYTGIDAADGPTATYSLGWAGGASSKASDIGLLAAKGYTYSVTYTITGS